MEKVLNLIMWIVGVLVSLAVGFGMTTNGPLNSIPYIPGGIVSVAGWVVIVGTLIGIVMAILKAVK